MLGPCSEEAVGARCSVGERLEGGLSSHSSVGSPSVRGEKAGHTVTGPGKGVRGGLRG